jgi:hypothetical protein
MEPKRRAYELRLRHHRALLMREAQEAEERRRAAAVNPASLNLNLNLNGTTFR